MNKGLAIGIAVIAATLVIGTVVFNSSHEPAADTETTRQVVVDETTRQVVVDEAARQVVVDEAADESGLTTEIADGFGAAARVPEDVSAYSASLNLAERWTRIWQSNAVQNLMSLPTVQQAWMQGQSHPFFASLMQTAETHPVAMQGLPVLKDALSTEVFICAGPNLAETTSALGDLYGEMQVARLQSQIAGVTIGSASSMESAFGDMIETVMENEERLKLPSFLIGFHLTDVDAATQFIDEWLPQINTGPFGVIEKRSINDGQFFVLDTSGQQLPDGVIAQMTSALQAANQPADVIERLTGFVRGQRVIVAIGVLDDYLMVSLSSDTGLLERWNTGSSLAKSESFAPARTHFKEGLATLSYTAKSMAAKPVTPEDVQIMVEYILYSIPDFTVVDTLALANRIRKDVKLLAGEFPTSKPHETLAFSFDNKGTETFKFGAPFPSSLDSSLPLSVLTHRGPQPIVASAARAAKHPDGYEQAVKWIKVAFGYFEDFGVPAIPAEDRAKYEQGMSIAIPFLTSIDAATRDHLVPAVDGTQSIFVMDGRGELAVLPDGDVLQPPLVIPRFGTVIELNDAEQFKTAITNYTEASRKLIADINAAYPLSLPAGVTIPAPQTAQTAGGTHYFYPLPVDLGRDILPSALIKDRLLVLSSSASLAEHLVEEQPMPGCTVTGTDAAAGAVIAIEFTELWDFFRNMGDSAFMLALQKNRTGNIETMTQIKMHSDAILRSLEAVRSYRGTTTLYNGRAMQHSWLHVEDISR
jgi:hypothetical protein